MPEPDIVLTTESLGEGPVPLASVKMLVEISDTTLVTDLGRKAVLYASHGIPEYWVVNLDSKSLHQFWLPTPGAGYAEQRNIAFGGTCTSVTLAGVCIDTAVLS